MSSIRGLVADTISFSNVDGPGNRFVVFLQGCNFDCIACHNPYTIGICDGCGECVSACAWQALSFDGTTVGFDAGRCHGDDACIAACPIDASPKALWRSVPDLLAAIEPAAPFLSGITVSGGEATQQASFVRALFEAVRHHHRLSHLTRYIDSNGAAPAAVWEELLPVTDGAMIDLKCLDPAIHRTMTGQDNAEVLATIRLLARHRRLAEVRLLILPGINDDPELLQRTAEWLADVDPHLALRIIGFRCHGVRPHLPALIEPDDEHLRSVEAVFRSVAPFATCLI
jgi:YjjW family glycine radical enzyme activase